MSIQSTLNQVSVAVLLLGLAGGGAHAEAPAQRHQTAHVHGVAHLSIAAEGNRVQAELVSPAANLIGFEHQPRNDRERETLNLAQANLEAGDSMIRFNTEAGCRLDSVAIESDLDDGHSHDHAHGSGGDAAGHADIHVLWEFSCHWPDALGSAALGLFSGFPALERVLVQYATPEGQGGAETTPGNPIVRFVPF
jgi:hypothetical protein